MKVCICCENPEVYPEIRGVNPALQNAMMFYIEVPDGTPIIGQGRTGRPCISGQVLRDAGLQWRGYWCTPEGRMILAPYVLTPSGLAAWLDALLNSPTELIAYLKSTPGDDSIVGLSLHLSRQSAVLLAAHRRYCSEQNEEDWRSSQWWDDIKETLLIAVTDLPALHTALSAVQHQIEEILTSSPAAASHLLAQGLATFLSELNLILAVVKVMYCELSQWENDAAWLELSEDRLKLRVFSRVMHRIYAPLAAAVIPILITNGYTDSPNAVAWEYDLDEDRQLCAAAATIRGRYPENAHAAPILPQPAN